MRIGYADPPYPGQSAKHYADHPDFAGEVDHAELLTRLERDYDGWVLHTSSTAVPFVLGLLGHQEGDDYQALSRLVRVMAWVKPFAAFKKNVPVAYAWEPVIVKPCRKAVVSGRVISRDFISEPITMKRGLAGAKPEAVCRWAFEVVGAEPTDQTGRPFPWDRSRAVRLGSLVLGTANDCRMTTVYVTTALFLGNLVRMAVKR